MLGLSFATGIDNMPLKVVGFTNFLLVFGGVVVDMIIFKGILSSS